jgi:hypothetical protein
VAGAVRGVAGAPFARAAEIARGDQAVRGLLFGQRNALAIDHHLTISAFDTTPGDPPGGQFTHRFRRHVGEHARDLLIAAPVGTTHGVFEMYVLVVALALDAVGQTGLHAALRGDRMRTLGRHQRQNQRFQPAPLGADGGTQTDDQHARSAADDQHPKTSV